MSDNRLGITKILHSTKATAFLITLLTATVLSFANHLSPTFAAVIATIFSVFSVSHAYINGQAIQSSATLQSTITKVQETR